MTDTLDLVAHMHRARAFSLRTFGPGARTKGVIDHIRKELLEIEAAPSDIEEWVDVVILALDGAWRSGATPEQIAKAISDKQAKNEARNWPDWRTAPTDKAIEHVKDDPPRGPGTNTGHGHVWGRPDGTRMRCGGPGLCSECARDWTAQFPAGRVPVL